ncbi:MAG: beta-N-acetylhexosaminidase [Bacteroidales bacterium]
MTNIIVYLALIVFLVLSGCKNVNSGKRAKNIYAVIPAPLSLIESSGKFTFSAKSSIVLSPMNEETLLSANFLASLVKNYTGYELVVKEGSKATGRSVFMSIDTSVKNPEAYIFSVTPKKITVKAATPAGLFYAVQTIRQLMPPEVEKSFSGQSITLSVPCCEIKDEPRFIYRGMHLDVGRHMFPVETIKKYIDLMALHKFNYFHWHLTEDQGWRIEIKKYPKLTEIGAFRKETIVGHAGRKPQVFDGKRYGGFYSQDEVREIVKYASSKFITVIPEIEMPGHSLAALASYPELSCTGGPFETGTKWGIFEDVYCAGKEETFRFLEDVLSEVIELFPSEYIHIGGDECPKTRWEKCPLCQKRIKIEGLKDEHELQSYFIKRIEKFLISKGKRLIGWDEIMEGGLAPEATVMSWRGIASGIEAAKQNHNVIMTPTCYFYLDYYQAEPDKEPLAIGGYLPLETVYSFDPHFEELTEEQHKHILGVQGNVWTEYIPSPGHLEYMACPRMFAISEVGWTQPSKKDFEDFLARFTVQCARYDAMNINYFKGEYRNTRTGKKI